MKPDTLVIEDLRVNGASNIRQIAERVRTIKPTDLSNVLRVLAQNGKVIVDRSVDENGRAQLSYRLP